MPVVDKILTIFKQAAERFNRKEPAFTKASFKGFLLHILILQDKYFSDKKLMKNSAGIKRIELNYDLVLQSLNSFFKTKQHGPKSIVADDS